MFHKRKGLGPSAESRVSNHEKQEHHKYCYFIILTNNVTDPLEVRSINMNFVSLPHSISSLDFQKMADLALLIWCSDPDPKVNYMSSHSLFLDSFSFFNLYFLFLTFYLKFNVKRDYQHKFFLIIHQYWPKYLIKRFYIVIVIVHSKIVAGIGFIS